MNTDLKIMTEFMSLTQDKNTSSVSNSFRMSDYIQKGAKQPEDVFWKKDVL